MSITGSPKRDFYVYTGVETENYLLLVGGGGGLRQSLTPPPPPPLTIDNPQWLHPCMYSGTSL